MPSLFPCFKQRKRVGEVKVVRFYRDFHDAHWFLIWKGPRIAQIKSIAQTSYKCVQEM